MHGKDNPMAFNPTSDQLNIAQAFKATQGNISIDAGAGSGKTTTAVWLIEEHIPPTNSVLMCVFNTRNKKEIDAKFKSRGLRKASAKTFNGMAFSAYLKKYDIKDADREIDLDTDKYSTLVRWWINKNLPVMERTPEQIKEAREFLKSLIHLFMVNTTRNHRNDQLSLFTGGSLNEPSSLMPHDPVAGAEEIATRYDLYGLEMVMDEVKLLAALPELLNIGKLCFEKPEEAHAILGKDERGRDVSEALAAGKPWIDFADQVYWCVVDNWKVWQSDVVIVDEAQDLSPLQRALVNMHLRTWGTRRGRLIMVGDPAQAINAWNGADNDGFTNSMIFWNISKAEPLIVCWRCFQEVCELAAGWKKGFKAAPNAISGTIATVNHQDVLEMVQDGDALVSRVRSATVAWWRALTRAGKPAKILGSNPADVIIRILEAISNQKGFEYRKLRDFVFTYRETKLARMHERNKPESAIEAFLDDIAMVLSMIDDVDAPNMDALIEKIKDELNPANMPEGGVQIMTGHGAKGGEWPHVFCITPDQFPMIRTNQTPEEYIQEKNLEYVMQTRAMEALYFVKKDAPSFLHRTILVPADAQPILQVTSVIEDKEGILWPSGALLNPAVVQDKRDEAERLEATVAAAEPPLLPAPVGADEPKLLEPLTPNMGEKLSMVKLLSATTLTEDKRTRLVELFSECPDELIDLLTDVLQTAKARKAEVSHVSD
jgi:superfamily I DNA/RNA helicase